MRLELIINPRKVGIVLGMIAVYFALQSIIAEYLIENVLDNEVHRSLVQVIDLFSVNAEETIPTWYATLLLFAASVLVALIAVAKRASQDHFRHYWSALALIFLYLSMDEGAVIHEIVADALQTNLNLTGFFAFGWQIVAIPLLIVVGLLFLRFVVSLPRQIRNRFVVSGIIYISGAIVVEGISANQWYMDGGISFHYLAIATIEELCEMLGIVIFIYSLLSYAVEMQYAFIFDSPPIAETSRNLANKSRLATYIPSGSIIAIAIVIIGLNVGLLTWAFAQEPPVKSTEQNVVQAPPHLIDQFAVQGVLVTRLIGIFGSDNLEARQVSARLLDMYDEVIVVTMNSSNSSLVLAAHEIPFDRDQIAELLRENGETQFIIFDTPAVKAIVGNA
jgi:hypothetical protein